MKNENLILKDWRNIDFSFGLVYPNVYKIGMSSYSLRLLYYMINSYEHIACERFFLPEKIRFPASDDLNQNRPIRSVENQVLMSEFDIIGFSLQYENDFKNLLWLLDNSQIPISSQERMDLRENGKDLPLIIAGGPVATSNPLPFAPMIDLFFIGDSEPNLGKFLDVFRNYKLHATGVKELLKQCEEIEGIYIPSLNNKVKRSIQYNLDHAPIPDYQLISKEKTIFESNLFLEVNRGCPFRCKFCISSFHNEPFRNRSYEKLIKEIDKISSFIKFNKISMIGSCVSAHPRFKEVCEYILEKDLRFSIPSIRIEHISSDIINLLERNNTRTITIAPETGSEQLRKDLGKNITNKTIYTKVELIKKSKIRNIKFYFLLGLPGETEKNMEELIEMLIHFNEMGFDKDALRVNINPFIPKLNTPYQIEVETLLEENLKSLNRKFIEIEKRVKRIPAIQFKTPNIKEAIKHAKLQALISLGDAEVSRLLMNYYHAGANFGALRRVEKQWDLTIDDYFKKVQNGYVPWTFN